jgi:putative nucleotidyltransferase with HDIG domain
MTGRRFGGAGPSASGHRLARAFDALERFPALAHSRDQLLDLLHGERPDHRAIVAVVESDAALALAVLAAVKDALGLRVASASIPRAIEALPRDVLVRAVSRVRTVEFLERTAADAEAFRLHALAVQRNAERIRRDMDLGRRDEIAVAALLHDLGKIVMLTAYDRYRDIAFLHYTPEEKLALERRELGVDHALAGGVLARRLGLPDRLIAAICEHHSDEASPEVALVRLADMLAHYQAAQPVDRSALRRVARTVGLDDDALRSLLYALPEPSPPQAGAGAAEPSPLSMRQHEILRLLAEGRQYKQIAHELGLSTSTVRSHLTAIYTKLEVADRAQAVLLASRRGWL